MVSLNEKRSKVQYVVQNKTEWVDGKFYFTYYSFNKLFKLDKIHFLFKY